MPSAFFYISQNGVTRSVLCGMLGSNKGLLLIPSKIGIDVKIVKNFYDSLIE